MNLEALPNLGPLRGVKIRIGFLGYASTKQSPHPTKTNSSEIVSKAALKQSIALLESFGRQYNKFSENTK